MKHFKDFLPLCLGHPRGALTHPQLLVASEPQSSRRGSWEHSATCWGPPEIHPSLLRPSPIYSPG